MNQGHREDDDVAGLKLLAFCGSTSRPSKTASLVQAVAERISARIDTRNTLHDLSGFLKAPLSYDRAGLPHAAARVLDDIEEADILIVGSPVYKGSYSGLFKHVFDLVGPDRLMNKPVVLCATGGGHRHALMVEHQLRPLFGFFGAVAIPIAIYASDSDFRDGAVADAGVLQRIDMAVDSLARIVRPQVPFAGHGVGHAAVAGAA